MKRAILYLRLSVSNDTSTSIVRQREDLEALAAREDWTIVATFADDGLSGGKERANAKEALRMIREGEADVLAVWKFDRWSRQGLGAVADLVAALDHRERLTEAKKGTPALFVALGDGLRSDQPAWRIIASVLAEVARQERENIRYRTKSSIAKLKRSGRWSGGTVPLGYQSAPHPDGAGRILVPNPDESAVLAEAAKRIVGGASVYATTAWLNASAVRPRRASSWTVQALTQALTGSAIVGRVTVGGDVLRDEDGMPAQVWDPAIPLDLWHAVRATLESRREGSPRVGKQRPGRRSRLLTGILACGECGGPMYVRKSSNGVALYSCSARSNGRDCPGVIVTAERIEEHVVETFLAAVGRYEVLKPIERDAPALALVEAEAALADISARLGDPDLDDETEERLLAQRRDLRTRVRSLRVDAATAAPEIDYVPTGEIFRDVWDEISEDLDARRNMLAEAFESIEITKGKRGGHGLDPARVRLYWRQVPENYDAE
ncbi:recombinase family protein [Diaminobutyricimonas sp. TR449]|uniref:recombinase family protein n=1 Tax=Diaminobutyricimonas sp. TR449 TaxID=2708076 RepID=UPI001423D78C|nr:recombinase family protein [Diaminobutyricimonas sp. TR449]